MKTFTEMWNGFIAEQNTKELRKERPLHEWPTELLEWLFWQDRLTNLDKSCRIIEMIHAEMNARGEGDRVAV